jgi:nicotinamide-nucleotide adenylyltransferase
MGNLIKEWVKEILTEEVNDIVVVYAGRFQPFHKGHYATYSHLVQKFGKDAVWIGTSNKSGGPKDPFNFLEKKTIMTTMFDIPKNKVVQVKNPYNPTEILSGFSPKTTAFVTVVGEKDAQRLGGKYFKKFHAGTGFKPASGYEESGYVYTSPSQPNSISGTDVRKWLSTGDESQRKAGFKKAYPKFNPKIYNMITQKLGGVNEIISEFFNKYNLIPLIESTLGSGYVADAGENDAIYVLSGKKRVLGLGKDAQKNDYWFVSGGYTQIEFPKADVIIKKSAKGTGDFYQYAVRRKVFTMDDLLDIPETEDYVTADIATTPLDVAPPEAPPEVEIDVTGMEDEELQEVFRGLGYEIVEWVIGKKLQILDRKQYKLLERIGKKFTGYLTEGGAWGHMNHPFDLELGLTFGDLKNIITKALKGDLELTREKTDGQALAISWRDDKGLIAARNKGHLANRGENAMNAADVASKFGGRGGLTDAYNFAMRDLETAVKGLSKAQRDKIFKQGTKFMNLEVIYPTSVNVIPYGQALLVFHNTTEYDESGVAIGADQSDAKVLAGMIKQINQHVQDKYTIQGPPITQLPKEMNLQKLQPKYLGMLNKLQSKYGLKDSDGMAEYHQAWWGEYIDKNAPEKLDNSTREGLIKRWAFYDKSFVLNSNNIKSEKVLEWAKGIDKNDHQKISKDNIRPFEDIFLGVGADVLSLMSSVLTVNPDEAVRNMKQRLDQTIKDVQSGGDEKKIRKLQLELERMAAVGGTDKIVPNEGIVFVYKGNTLKLTGSFASLNQILGLFY